MPIASPARRDTRLARHTAMRVGAILYLGLVVLTGCATLSEGECKTADWYQIGRQDGADGYPRSRLYAHRKACIKYGVSANANRYYAGRRVGLKRYCTPNHGFREGREGNRYHDVCPITAERAFLRAYRHGRAIHAVDEDIEHVKHEIDREEYQLDDNDTSAQQAHHLRESLRDHYHELHRLNDELTRLEQRLGIYAPDRF